jgi:hypothetical protein
MLFFAVLMAGEARFHLGLASVTQRIRFLSSCSIYVIICNIIIFIVINNNILLLLLFILYLYLKYLCSPPLPVCSGSWHAYIMYASYVPNLIRCLLYRGCHPVSLPHSSDLIALAIFIFLAGVNIFYFFH